MTIVGLRWIASSLVLAAGLLAAQVAHAQVDCTNPDNLCTGDPCVIGGTVAVAASCVADFRPRTLVIAGTVTVPAGGTLTLTAASVQVTGVLQSKSTSATVGGNPTLVATDDIDVTGRILTSGAQPGTTTLDAGGNVSVSGTMRRGHAVLTAGGNIAI